MNEDTFIKEMIVLIRSISMKEKFPEEVKQKSKEIVNWLYQLRESQKR